MVEVALALAIVGIGIAGIMSLFPVALNANRQALGDNYAPDVANLLFSYIQMECSKNNANWIAYIGTDSDQAGKHFTTNKPSIDIVDETFNTAIPFQNVIFPHTSDKDMFQVIVKSNDVVEFNGVVRVWKEQVKKFYVSAGNILPTINYQYASGIHMEITWPQEKPYDQRYKRHYYLEMFNPNP